MIPPDGQATDAVEDLVRHCGFQLLPWQQDVLRQVFSLTDEDRSVLDFAGRRYLSLGARADAVRDELGLTFTRYTQRLNRLLDEPAALAYAPQTVNRLRRITRR